MSSTRPISHLLKKLWHHIGSRRRAQFGWLLLLMILASFAEVLSIGAVLPFLGVLTAPDKVFSHPVAQPLVQALGFTQPAELLMPLTAVFCLAALTAGAMRLILLWASTRLSYATGADLSISIYRRTLYQPYSVHVARNSSEIISGISDKSGVVIGTIVMVLTLATTFFILTSILVALLLVDPVVALAAFSGFGVIYILIILFVRKRLQSNGQRIAREATQRIKALQEGLGGIRDVLIDGSQAAYCSIYHSSDYPLRCAQGSSAFISASPRYGMEALGMLLIAALAFSLASQPDGVARAVPVLGALALGAQRLLPVLQQAYMAFTGIQGGQASLQDAIDLLDQPLPDHADQPLPAPLPFRRDIDLRSLSFRYADDAPWVLRDLDLSIKKGSRVGFVGTTGSGKSTLLDIVMGLLPPTEGTLEIDGQAITAATTRAWQAHIAHVPQAIYLADNTIEENIAFGIPKAMIDHQRIRHAARQAQIAETIEAWPAQYQTFVGERGVRLSGGQRQRIGIARALYKQADVIIFDEATSALDSETEEAVMQAIEGLSGDLTILIIAHRLTTLKGCTQIVRVGECADPSAVQGAPRTT
ncbi:MAG: ABC transporter ATP-binding protein [Sulfuritalea sp.]|nr:ABC transporter ATP-binding protein [Sulfuritalea sp.]